MERTIPISIAVRGHPLVESVALSWSAQGMIPQVMRFGTEGGITEATIMSEKCSPVSIRYQAKINFKFPSWGVVEIKQEKSIAPEEEQKAESIVLDLGAWIRHLTIQLKVSSESQHIRQRSNNESPNHLIVNLTWKSPSLHQTQKYSGRITPQTPLQFTYLQDPETRDTSATLSGFGVIEGKLVQLTAQAIDLKKDLLLLLTTQNTIQLM